MNNQLEAIWKTACVRACARACVCECVPNMYILIYQQVNITGSAGLNAYLIFDIVLFPKDTSTMIFVTLLCRFFKFLYLKSCSKVN
jgi:hypothetical protein